jgi:hypothetical protein
MRCKCGDARRASEIIFAHGFQGSRVGHFVVRADEEVGFTSHHRFDALAIAIVGEFSDSCRCAAGSCDLVAVGIISVGIPIGKCFGGMDVIRVVSREIHACFAGKVASGSIVGVRFLLDIIQFPICEAVKCIISIRLGFIGNRIGNRIHVADRIIGIGIASTAPRHGFKILPRLLFACLSQNLLIQTYRNKETYFLAERFHGIAY